MLFPSRVCVFLTTLIVCFIGSNALVINYFDAPNVSSFNCSLMQLWHQRDYKREIPAGFTDYGVGAYKFHKEPLTWGKAMKVCEAEGAHLVIVNSQHEEDVLLSFFAKYPSAEIKGAENPDYVAVGVHDYFNEGEFLTLHGKPLESTGFVHWHPTQPNGAIKENVVVMHRKGTLHDTFGTSFWPYICEFDARI